MSDENWTGSIGTDGHLRLGSGAGALFLESVNGILQTRSNISGTQVRANVGYPGATLLIAANDSAARAKRNADFVCNGVEDGIVINQALASLPTTPGGVLLAAEGTFVEGNTGIQILGGAKHFRGLAKRGSTFITAAAGSTVTAMAQVGTAGTGNLFNNSISNMTFDGTNLGSTATAIVASSNMWLAEDLYIANIANGFSGLSQTAIEFAFQRLRNIDMFQVTNDGVITDANIDDFRCEEVTVGGVFNVTPGGRYGFNLSSNYTSLVDCRAHDMNDGWGVFVSGGVETRILGGHFDENGKSASLGGIHCDANTRINVIGATFNNNNSYDVYFSNTSNSSVVGCQSNGAGTKGPSVCSINIAGCTYVTVSDNNLVDMQTRGIVLSSSTQCNVHDNMISNPSTSPTQASIRVFASLHNQIHHNTVANGISEESTSDFNSFDRNNLAGGSMTKVGASSVVTAFP